MPDRYHLIVLPRAANDLREIFSYIEQDSPQNAVTVSARIVDAIDSLELFPHRFKVAASHNQADMVVRSMPVPPFLIYYRVDDRRRSVRLLTIRHGKQRQPRHFD